MQPFYALALLVAAYLIGSIPFSYLVGRIAAKKDIREQGSGNVGATNVMRTAGKGPGVLALLLDIAKGYAAVAVAERAVAAPGWPFPFVDGGTLLHAPSFWIGMSALLAVLGHLFPVWLNFRGGKGVATAAGVFLALDPKALGAALILFLIVIILSRYVSLASVVAAASLPLFIRFLSAPPFWINVAAVAIGVLIVLKHHSNIARLARGEERKFPR
jgi:glycerol-3-phosphate acyltransferase PlsY